MKIGDIIYFIKPHHALYTKGRYDFKIMKPYLVDTYNDTWVRTATVTDLETNESHFITDEAIDKTISYDKAMQLIRHVKLKELGI